MLHFLQIIQKKSLLIKKKNLTIINDSKSTSFSSSISLLKNNSNILWLVGGINKKGDKFNLSKKYHSNIRAFVYGKKKKFFNEKLSGKISYQNFDNLRDALKNIFKIMIFIIYTKNY